MLPGGYIRQQVEGGILFTTGKSFTFFSFVLIKLKDGLPPIYYPKYNRICYEVFE